jgi:hypothetical protein
MSRYAVLLEGLMRLLWTLVKVAVALAILVPLGFFAIGLTMAAVGIVFRLVFVAVRLAVFGALGYVGYRIFRSLRGSPSRPRVQQIQSLPSVDPYYQAAMRELDAEMGSSGGR